MFCFAGEFVTLSSRANELDILAGVGNLGGKATFH